MTGRARADPIQEPPESDEEQKRASPVRALAGPERVASVVLGGLLLFRGFRQGSRGGFARALVGGWLLYRGLRGHDHVSRALRAGPRSLFDRLAATSEPAASRTLTVGRPPEELSEGWRDPEQVTQLLDGFAEVTPAGDGRWRWSARAPFGRTLTWESQITEDRPGELVRWESLNGAALPNEGSVRFRPAPADQGTEVTLAVRLLPPGGILGNVALSRLNGVLDTLVGKALRRFRSFAETGEAPTLERNPSARGSGDLL